MKRKRPPHDLRARPGTEALFKGVGYAGRRRNCLRAFFRINGRHWSLDLGDRVNGFQIQRITKDTHTHLVGLVPEGLPIQCENAIKFQPGETIPNGKEE